MPVHGRPVIAGVDVGNATTEIAVLAGNEILGVDRLPTRGGKGSPESLRGAAALVRRIERRYDLRVDEARIAPLRPVETTTVAAAPVPPATGRLRLLAAGVATPGGAGSCVGVPLWLDRPLPAEPAGGGPFIAVIPPGLGYAAAAERLRGLATGGVPVAAVLVPEDEGVLVANRIDGRIPVVDQVDVAALASCSLVAVEVRSPGQQLTLLTDPVALAAQFGLRDGEASDAVTMCRSLVDYSNAVVGCGDFASVSAPMQPASGFVPEPWVLAKGQRVTLRQACALIADWPVGAVEAISASSAVVEVDDLFAVDLTAVADAATARRGSLGQAIVSASLRRLAGGTDQAGQLSDLIGCPVRCAASEPAAARFGALTTPGARPDAVVVDVGAGTIDVIAPDAEVVAAGAGDLLTAAIAQTLGIPHAAAEWVKRGPCVRVDGAQRFEAEDGSHGFLDRPARASAAGMLAVMGPAGLLTFDRGRTPAEWRAIRLRLKQAIFTVNLRRALGEQWSKPGQVLIVGGPAADEELLGVLLRSLPPGVAVGRGNVGGTLSGLPAGHRYAAALGLALAADNT
jgi:Diol dehydratase reactivase ATPase-like domain/DD-reactivating factor swiveling domain